MADSPLPDQAGDRPDPGLDRTSSASPPGWVKVFGIVGLVLAVLFVVLHLTGNSLGGHDHHRGHSPTQGGP
jgi:hypothetical protein